MAYTTRAVIRQTTDRQEKEEGRVQKQGLQQVVRDVEQHIIVLSGPLLATSGIISGLDIVTNNFIANNAPGIGAILGLIWAICLMLTLDFQTLVLGVRARRIYISNKSNGKKAFEMALAFAIALALGYVSLQMGSIFSRMMGTGISMANAQAQLGINPIWLIYERSAMVMLLIFMSGWLRDEEEDQVPGAVNTQSVPHPTASISGDTMNTIIRKLEKLDQLELAFAQQAALPPAQAQPMLEEPETPIQGIHEDGQGIHTTDEIPVLDTLEKQNVDGTSKQSYSEQIEALYKQNPEITISEVEQQLGCSRNTAAKWLQRCKPVGK